MREFLGPAKESNLELFCMTATWANGLKQTQQRKALRKQRPTAHRIKKLIISIAWSNFRYEMAILESSISPKAFRSFEIGGNLRNANAVKRFDICGFSRFRTLSNIIQIEM